MSYIDDLLEQLAAAKKERDNSIEFARRATVENIATQTGRPKLFAGYINQRVRVHIDAAGKPRIQILGDDGRVRFSVKNDGECVEFSSRDLLDELRKEFPEQTAAEPAKGDGDPLKGNLTERMKAERARQAAAATAPMSADEKSKARAANPFTKGAAFNLTEQMRVIKRDPTFAAELERLAGGRVDSVGA